MQQLEFFLLGLLVVWLTGTGKLASLWAALKTDPVVGSSSGTPLPPQSPGNTNPSPPSGAGVGTVYTGPDGKLYIVGPDGQPLQITA